MMNQVSSVAAPDSCPGHPEAGRHHGEGGAGWWCRWVQLMLPPDKYIFISLYQNANCTLTA